MSTTTFRKLGNAYVADLDQNNERFWLKRMNSRWHLLWQHRDSFGDRVMSDLGTFKNLDEAKKEAEILAAL